MTPQLVAQQRALAAAIVGDGSADGLTSGTSPNRSARVNVYRHAYRARLTEALRNNFPVLHRVLGDDGFGELAVAYMQAHPSLRPSIRWFGDGLVEYMSDLPDTVPHPSLVDLARMEWSLGLSFDSTDAAVLTPADLLCVAPQDWPSLCFEAHPSVALLALEWAVEPAWRAVTNDETAEVDAPEPSLHTLLVWRQQLDSRWRSVPEAEAALLQPCLGGQPFALLCEQAAATEGEGAAAFAAGALRRWVEDGLLARRLPIPAGS